MLHGNQESVFKNFQLDEKEWKFSKEKAVILTIQLIDQRYFKLTTPAKIILYINKNTSTSFCTYCTQLQRHRHRPHAVIPFDSEGGTIRKALG